MRTAVIDGTQVVNVIEAGPEFTLPGFLLVPTETAAPGWTYEDGEFVPPEPEPIPVPQEIEGWQAEVAMRATPVDPEDPESQNVWDRVQDIIAAMPDGLDKITAQTVLARGKVRHDSAMLAALAPLVPLSGERIDDMFRLGASIQA
ncbi:hypothetical protein ACSBPU_05525 [Parapusillimonas sp. JC17]|uniref:hypothetical protein n=1 Tax=Parapusillimonas sp. JC17 TaxID=3445768 RepID=UPI003FA114BA